MLEIQEIVRKLLVVACKTVFVFFSDWGRHRGVLKLKKNSHFYVALAVVVQLWAGRCVIYIIFSFSFLIIWLVDYSLPNLSVLKRKKIERCITFIIQIFSFTYTGHLLQIKFSGILAFKQIKRSKQQFQKNTHEIFVKVYLQI